MDFEKEKKSTSLLLLISYIVCFLRFVTLRHEIGAQGVGVFGFCFFLLLAYALFMRYAMGGILSKMINERMKNDSYRNAGKVFRVGFIVAFGIGLLFTIVHFFLGSFLADHILHMNVCGEVIRYMAPSYILIALSEVFSSYLTGSGDNINDSLIRLISELLISVLCFLISGWFSKYGVKVGNLLKNGNYMSVFGARGCALSVSIGNLLITFLYAFIYVQKKVALRRLIRMDKTPNEEESIQILHGAILQYFPKIIISFFLSVLLIVSLSVITSVGDGFVVFAANANIPDSLTLYGQAALSAFPVLIVCMSYTYIISLLQAKSWENYIHNEEIDIVYEEFVRKVRSYFVKGMPVLILILSLARPIADLLGSPDPVAASSGIIFASLAALFFGILCLFWQLYMAMKKKILVLSSGGIFFVVTLAFMLLAKSTEKNMITVVSSAFFAGFLCSAILLIVLLVLSGEIALPLVRLGKPVVCSLVSGGLGLLVSTLLFGKLPSVVLVLICMAAFLCIYMILMTTLHGFSKRELSQIPFGTLLKRFFYAR